MLQIGVGAEGESLLPAAAGIEFDQVARDVLDALLRLLLQSVPGTRAEGRQSGRLARIAAAVFADLIERVDGYIHLVVVRVDDANHLLIAVAHRHTNQSAKLSDAEIHVHDIVARLHLLQLLHRERHLAGTC